MQPRSMPRIWAVLLLATLAVPIRSFAFGATALMWAVSRAENVKALLARGADVNARASNGWTALIAATRYRTRR
jgi:ankyrin repeat protein